MELEIEWNYPLTQLNIPDGNTWHLVCVVVRNMERVNFFLRGCGRRTESHCMRRTVTWSRVAKLTDTDERHIEWDTAEEIKIG